ncbi:hypothetical protein KAU11_10420 [Candidatus Babeliales bacterium]|nr:hypothetical protein [Candidatus Babeliales bacterium]
MNENTPIEFDYQKEGLAEMVAKSKETQLTDRNDPKQVEKIEEFWKPLQQARITITKQGKDMRSGATAFGKAVLTREKELLGVMVNEEDRLKNLIDSVKEHKDREMRKKFLPERRAQVEKIGETANKITDEEILDMDDKTWDAYRFREMEAESDRVAEAKQKEVDDKESKEKEKEREAQAEIDKEKAVEQAKIDEAKRIEDEAKEKEENEKKESKKAERRKDYQEWAEKLKAKHGKDLFIRRIDGGFEAIIKLGEFKIEG